MVARPPRAELRGAHWVPGYGAVQPCRGREPLLLSLHFALAGKMLKVNGEIVLHVFGSLELL